MFIIFPSFTRLSLTAWLGWASIFELKKWPPNDNYHLCLQYFFFMGGSFIKLGPTMPVKANLVKLREIGVYLVYRACTCKMYLLWDCSALLKSDFNDACISVIIFHRGFFFHMLFSILCFVFIDIWEGKWDIAEWK